MKQGNSLGGPISINGLSRRGFTLQRYTGEHSARHVGAQCVSRANSWSSLTMAARKPDATKYRRATRDQCGQLAIINRGRQKLRLSARKAQPVQTVIRDKLHTRCRGDRHDSRESRHQRMRIHCERRQRQRSGGRWQRGQRAGRSSVVAARRRAKAPCTGEQRSERASGRLHCTHCKLWDC